MHKESFTHCHEASTNRYYSLLTSSESDLERREWIFVPTRTKDTWKLTFQTGLFLAGEDNSEETKKSSNRIHSAGCFREASMEIINASRRTRARS